MWTDCYRHMYYQAGCGCPTCKPTTPKVMAIGTITCADTIRIFGPMTKSLYSNEEIIDFVKSCVNHKIAFSVSYS